MEIAARLPTLATTATDTAAAGGGEGAAGGKAGGGDNNAAAATIKPPVGYIQLSGFSQDAGLELYRSYVSLERQSFALSGQRLSGLVLDLRGNPGGLLSSAVDVASLLVPKGSDLVSAQGRGFRGVLYRSNGDPIRDPAKTPLAVLVNSGTASAAEIVSGAVQDLDAGVVVGAGRTFGKGLVQNIESLSYDTALKFTVAKYYTPSGRCIQATEYKDSGRARLDQPSSSPSSPSSPSSSPSSPSPSKAPPSSSTPAPSPAPAAEPPPSSPSMQQRRQKPSQPPKKKVPSAPVYGPDAARPQQQQPLPSSVGPLTYAAATERMEGLSVPRAPFDNARPFPSALQVEMPLVADGKSDAAGGDDASEDGDDEDDDEDAEDGVSEEVAEFRRSRYSARPVKDKDRKTFTTRLGRPVKDGGGVEADVKVQAQELSLVELLLTSQGAIFDFVSEWTATNAYRGFDASAAGGAQPPLGDQVRVGG